MNLIFYCSILLLNLVNHFDKNHKIFLTLGFIYSLNVANCINGPELPIARLELLYLIIFLKQKQYH